MAEREPAAIRPIRFSLLSFSGHPYAMRSAARSASLLW